MEVLTKTTPETWLDEKTQEDLRPPCEASYPTGDGGYRGCYNSAEWAITLQCDSCKYTALRLWCQAEVDDFVSGALWTCRSCFRPSVTLSLIGTPIKL